ncbi:DUF3618 domain-containing protein [Mycobacterium sp.]|uniref:DUF3618 domain-containing protein n=1 Tax=Mycobacterium sp. TaxID=1785 RepID=UPI002C6D9CFD|nr:DUF3618 domain-containing protein [Mycobacterium sp.]HTH91474.1 DUF3618 domain-containing protein [Mycobacterium sp.]
MTTDKTPPPPQPGPNAGIDDIQTDIEQTRKELGETVEGLTGNADVKDEVTQKVADSKDRITEKANETREVAVEKADAAQSAARGAFADITGSLKPRVPIVALIAAAVVVSVVVWRRR